MNLAVFLTALALVESGGNDNAIGRHGERSRYQITQTVWRESMGPESFIHATTQPKRAKECTIRRLNWLRKNGVLETPIDLAYAWNCGLRGYRKARPGGKITNAGFDYAQRVERTYNELLAKQRRRTP